MKGPWEARVGKLLVPPDFAWSFKPPDSQFYGGQPRIDWLACDYQGRFWMVEVKQVGTDRQTINLLSDVSATQAQALNAVANGYGMTVLAVGKGDTLYIHSWRMAWLQYQKGLEEGVTKPELLKLTGPSLRHQYEWTGPKAWKNHELYYQFIQLGVVRDPIQRMTRSPSERLLGTASLASTWRPEDSTLTQQPTPLSERSSLE